MLTSILVLWSMIAAGVSQPPPELLSYLGRLVMVCQLNDDGIPPAVCRAHGDSLDISFGDIVASGTWSRLDHSARRDFALATLLSCDLDAGGSEAFQILLGYEGPAIARDLSRIPDAYLVGHGANRDTRTVKQMRYTIASLSSVVVPETVLSLADLEKLPANLTFGFKLGSAYTELPVGLAPKCTERIGGGLDCETGSAPAPLPLCESYYLIYESPERILSQITCKGKTLTGDAGWKEGREAFKAERKRIAQSLGPSMKVEDTTNVLACDKLESEYDCKGCRPCLVRVTGWHQGTFFYALMLDAIAEKSTLVLGLQRVPDPPPSSPSGTEATEK